MYDILNIFEKILKPYKNHYGGEKLNAIKKILNIKYKLKYYSGIGLIVNKQKTPNIIILSHIDLINKFNNKLLNNKKLFSIDDNFLIGALDNSITNAVLISILMETNYEKFNNIEIVFTESEEIDFSGISNYLKKYINKSKNALFINLDVTNEGFLENKSISLEYDKCNSKKLKKIIEKCKKEILYKELHLTNNRESDDIDIIVKNNLLGFSICIPTDEKIHSLKNKIKLNKLEKYKENIKKIIFNF